MNGTSGDRPTPKKGENGKFDMVSLIKLMYPVELVFSFLCNAEECNVAFMLQSKYRR